MLALHTWCHEIGQAVLGELQIQCRVAIVQRHYRRKPVCEPHQSCLLAFLSNVFIQLLFSIHSTPLTRAEHCDAPTGTRANYGAFFFADFVGYHLLRTSF